MALTGAMSSMIVEAEPRCKVETLGPFARASYAVAKVPELLIAMLQMAVLVSETLSAAVVPTAVEARLRSPSLLRKTRKEGRGHEGQSSFEDELRGQLQEAGEDAAGA